VTVEHDGRKVQTFVVYPEVKNKAPVVVVIHEIMGMTEWVQGVADELAEAGYIALAPGQVTADLNAVADYGKKLPSADGKVAVAGFCWGGSQSFRSATNRTDLAAAFVFYGTPPDNDSLRRIHSQEGPHRGLEAVARTSEEVVPVVRMGQAPGLV
jgi:carboxymethylenebutenolidase